MKVFRINPDIGWELTIFLMNPGEVFDVVCFLDYKEHEQPSLLKKQRFEINIQNASIVGLRSLFRPVE